MRLVLFLLIPVWCIFQKYFGYRAKVLELNPHILRGRAQTSGRMMRHERLPDDTNEFVVNSLYDEWDNIEIMEKAQGPHSLVVPTSRAPEDKAVKVISGRRNSDPFFNNKTTPESLDFQECESMMYRKHETRRFFQDRGHFWTKSRLVTLWKWIYCIIVAFVVGCFGCFITTLIDALLAWKFSTAVARIEEGNWAAAFFAYQFMSLFFISVAGTLCYFQPIAIGGGIPEIKAFLNGVNLSQFVNIRLLVAKTLGLCFAIGAGLPIGKKGPIIQIGSILGAVISQGKNKAFGMDLSWTKFQEFRNDYTKRDFVTYGTAAGVAAGFRAPIGGVLFALEEGASFWSTSLTFRTFVCATVTMMTVSFIFDSHGFGFQRTSEMFVFGQFKDLHDGKTNFRSYEIFIFILMGATGGVIGALFNVIHIRVAKYYGSHMATPKLKFVRLLMYTVGMACISFLLPLAWQKCTRLPTDEETVNWTDDEVALLDSLVPFQCESGHYNELASLYFVTANQCIKNLFHFREYGHSTFPSFTAGPLILFFLSYFPMTMLAGGLAIPMGLFVPSLVAGAAYGRIWGHALNSAFPNSFADSGTYSLMGAAAINGGVTRITLAMTIIMLETAGNMTYLLPLMVTFAAARYTGKVFNDGIYDITLKSKDFPFLDSALHTLGLLNYNPVTEIMAAPVITLCEIDKVSRVYEVLKHTSHNGFPTIDRYGRYRGLILRKYLCVLLELRAFSATMNSKETAQSFTEHDHEDDGVRLTPAAVVFYETLEKKYPKYPNIDDITLAPSEMDMYLDMRAYMDTSAHMIHDSTSVARCHDQFRTMGLRHLVVIDSNHHVVGMVTRKDITDKALRAHWEAQGEHMEKYVNVEPLPPAVVYENDLGHTDIAGLPTTFGQSLDDSGSSKQSNGSHFHQQMNIKTLKDHSPATGLNLTEVPPARLDKVFPRDDIEEYYDDDLVSEENITLDMPSPVVLVDDRDDDQDEGEVY